MPNTFERDYFNKFYKAQSRRSYREANNRLITGLTSLIEYHDRTPRSALEVGAGLGHWRDWFSRNRQSTHFVSTDISEHTCKKYKHQPYDVTTGPYKGQGRRRKYDLVVCLEVMSYFDKAQFSAVIRTLASMTGRFLVMDTLTKNDLANVCGEGTDWNIKGQTAGWYKKTISPYFNSLGNNLFVPRTTDLLFYETDLRWA